MIKINIPLGFVLGVKIGGECKDCVFFDASDPVGDCSHIACISNERDDGRDVIYRLLKRKYDGGENERKTD